MKIRGAKCLLASAGVFATLASSVSGVKTLVNPIAYYLARYLILLKDYICHYIWSDFYEKQEQNCRKIEDFSKECDFCINPVDKNSQDVVVITWPNNFSPKAALNNEKNQVNSEYTINKLEYNVSTGELFVYSPNYESGKVPIKLEEEEVEALLNSIKKQKTDFDFSIINKVKNQISEKYKNIKWELDDISREYKGTFEVAGMNFTISLQSRRHYGEWRNGKRDEKYQCEIKILDGIFLYCDAFNEEEEKKFTNLMSNLKFCVPEIKKLQETGVFEESKFSIDDFELVPKKPFCIKFSDGDVYKVHYIAFCFGSNSHLNFELGKSFFSEGIVYETCDVFRYFEFDKESKRKKFCNFVKLLVDKKDEENIIIDEGEYDPDLLPDPPENYTKSFGGKLSPCKQKNCNIQFKNGELN